MEFFNPFPSTLHSSIENTMITSPFSLPLSSPPSSSSDYRSLNIEMTTNQKMGRYVRIIITFTLAAVGSLIGGVSGGVMGLSTECGLLRGAALGAISGALSTIEAIESSLSIWLTNQSTTWSLLKMVDIAFSLLSGRLVREKIGPNMQSAVQTQQMDEVDMSLLDDIDLFDIGGTEGLPSESIDKIPKISITSENNVDAMGERISCVVCLQDFEIGEEVRCLPHCQHIFHLPCIDDWLIRHGSCPLCRWNV